MFPDAGPVAAEHRALCYTLNSKVLNELADLFHSTVGKTLIRLQIVN